MKSIRFTIAWGFLALVVASVFYLNIFVFHKLTIADDPFFSAALDHQGLLDFLRFRYWHWSGRIPIEMAMVLIINHMAVWKVLNSLMVLLLCYSIGRIGFGRHLEVPASMACAFALLMLIPPRVLWEAAWWVSGSFNYLWPVALGAYGSLHFFDRRERSAPHKVSLIVASGVAAYNEQVGFVLLCLLVPLLLRRIATRTCSAWDIAHIVFVAVNLAIALAAPGIQHRYQLEQARWFANFETLGVLEKVNIGLGLIKQSVLDSQNLLVAVFAAVAAGSVVASPASRLARIGLLTGLAFIGSNYLVALLAPVDSRLAAAYTVKSVAAINAAYPKVYLVMASSLFSIACLVIATTQVFRRSGRESIFVAWALLAGLASIAALGWSLTADASGSRIQFVGDVVFVAVTCRVLVVVREQFRPAMFRSVMLVVGSVAAWRTLQLAFGL